MAYTTIDNPELFFNTVIYAGNGSSPRSITGVGFQPDWVWTKNRSAANSNTVGDSVRGTGKTIFTDSTSAELTNNGYGYHSSFDADGFAVTGDTVSAGGDNVNKSGNNYVSWNWKAGGSASNNTDGGITSSVSVSQDAGFSIATWTGTGSTATIGHGLNAVPKMIITKARSNAYDWYIYHASIGNTKAIYLNLTNAESGASANFWNNTTPTSSVWTAGGNVFNNNYTFVTYAFAEKKGYSKFGSYTGNGNSDGPFVYTGFKPAWLLIKRTEASAKWFLWDNKREPFNLMDSVMVPSSSEVENTDPAFYMDFLSNGFKLRNTFGDLTASGEKFIYMAFAESPFVNSAGVPNNSR